MSTHLQLSKPRINSPLKSGILFHQIFPLQFAGFHQSGQLVKLNAITAFCGTESAVVLQICLKSVLSKPAKYFQVPQSHNIFIIFHHTTSQLGVELGRENAANATQNNTNKESIWKNKVQKSFLKKFFIVIYN
jgi:amino acid permease